MTVEPPTGGREPSWMPWAGGLAICAWFIAWRPDPQSTQWAESLLLLAAWVLVPLVNDLVQRQPEAQFLPVASCLRAARWLWLPAASLLTLAYCRGQDYLSAACALPWLVLCILLALAGHFLFWRSRGPGRAGIGCALLYSVVGGGWVLLDRAGERPLDFDPAIVLLTAIHFHYAGLVLPLVAGLIRRRADSTLARGAELGAIAGVPLVAAGITSTQLGGPVLLESLAAWVMGGSGLVLAGLLLGLALLPGEGLWVRVLWFLAGAALLGAQLLALAYGARHFIALEMLDIPFMRAVHGSLNALGFGLLGLMGWRLSAR